MKFSRFAASLFALALLAFFPLAAQADSSAHAEAPSAEAALTETADSQVQPATEFALPSFEASLAQEASLNLRACFPGEENYCETAADCPLGCPCRLNCCAD